MGVALVLKNWAIYRELHSHIVEKLIYVIPMGHFQLATLLLNALDKRVNYRRSLLSGISCWSSGQCVENAENVLDDKDSKQPDKE